MDFSALYTIFGDTEQAIRWAVPRIFSYGIVYLTTCP